MSEVKDSYCWVYLFHCRGALLVWNELGKFLLCGMPCCLEQTGVGVDISELFTFPFLLCLVVSKKHLCPLFVLTYLLYNKDQLNSALGISSICFSGGCPCYLPSPNDSGFQILAH